MRDFFRQLNNMFYVFLASIFLFMLSVMIVVYFQGPLDSTYTTYLYFAAPLSTVALLVMANRFAAGRFKAAASAQKLFEKMDAYRSGSVLRMIILDGAAFVQLIAFVFTASYFFLALAVAMATVFLLYKPGLEKFVKDLELNEVERKVMRDHSF